MNRHATTVRRLVALIGLVFAGGAWSDDYVDAWGPAVGSPLPLLEAPDQTGAIRTLEDLAGPGGLLLFLSRSADW